jgi:probable rRNA maturation factor
MRQAIRAAPRPPRAGLQVAVTDGLGRGIPPAGLDRWLARVAPRRARGTMTIALVSDARMRALNRRYRGKDYATDVLSFPVLADLPDRPAAPRSSGQVRSHLGDIVIARGVAGRQARAAGHGTPEELRILALHGLLHLLGYDHERDHGQMARLERRLRRQGGLREALTER